MKILNLVVKALCVINFIILTPAIAIGPNGPDGFGSGQSVRSTGINNIKKQESVKPLMIRLE